MISKELEDKINKELVIPKIDCNKQTNDITKWIRGLVQKDKVILFYQSAKWRKLREEVLKAYHYECVLCKMEGKITTHDNRLNSGKHRGLQVHHMREVELYPEHGLKPTIIDPITMKVIANLIPLCHHHHNCIHEKENNICKKKIQLNEERW